MAEDALLSSITRVLQKFQIWALSHGLSSPSSYPPSQHSPLEEDLAALKRLLLRIEAVVDDAEDRAVLDSSVALWLAELRAVAYDADDLLDEYEYELLRAMAEFSTKGAEQVWIPSSKRVLDLGTVSTPTTGSPPSMSSSKFRYKKAAKAKKIMQRFEEIGDRRLALHLREGEGERHHEKRPERTPSTHLRDSTNIYGREDDLQQMTEWVLSGECMQRDLSVVSVVGMGGVGKTTLVQHLYNQQRVCDHFDLRGWTCVSSDFHLVRLTKRVIEAFAEENCNSDEPSKLHSILIKVLKGKRFLLVLDDLWNEDIDLWEKFQLPIRHGKKGSVIISTTRMERVARIMRTDHLLHLDCLSDGDCWKIFEEKAFREQELSQNEDLVDMGKQIVAKCRGLPLAARSVGALLGCEPESETWKDILESNQWELNDRCTGVIPALRLSYLHLRTYLKRCFVYCHVFPKDFRFKPDELVLMWMAQGLLPSKSGKEAEDVGTMCFYELKQRSFFQVDPKDPSFFVMHDLLHDLAQCISRGEHIQREKEKADSLLCLERVRHLSIVNAGSSDTEPVSRSISYHVNMRTLLVLQPCWFSQRSLGHLLEQALSLEFLRVLSLSNLPIDELPDSVGNLKHLRYLNLDSTHVERLPRSICKLYHLQTLKLENCYYLRCLPEGMKELQNLRHLSVFLVGKAGEGCGIEELRQMVHLRCIKIFDLRNVEIAEDAAAAGLSSKRSIHELVLGWSDEPRKYWRSASRKSRHVSPDAELKVFEHLQPPKGLTKLEVYDYGGPTFPSWITEDPSSFSRLVHVGIYNCSMCRALPALGQLPSLRHLEICRVDAVEVLDSRFHGRAGSGFPSLEVLEFCDMEEWVRWDGVKRGDFPRLRRLMIKYCPVLRSMLPLYILPALEVLHISDCHQLGDIDLWGPSSSPPPSSSVSMAWPPLREMKISSCWNARFPLGAGDLPSTLLHLSISADCFVLVAGYRSKLDRIPHVRIWRDSGNGEFLATSPPKGSSPR